MRLSPQAAAAGLELRMCARCTACMTIATGWADRCARHAAARERPNRTDVRGRRTRFYRTDLRFYLRFTRFDLAPGPYKTLYDMLRFDTKR